jgi:hypothetical protein
MDLLCPRLLELGIGSDISTKDIMDVPPCLDLLKLDTGNGPGVDSAFNRNEYQESSWG